MEKCLYKIGFHNWYQSELTWKQDKQLIKLFKRLALTARPDDDFRVESAIKLFEKYDLLQIFYSTILRRVRDWRFWLFLGLYRPNVNALSNSEIDLINTDFFLLNQKLQKKLQALDNSLGLIYQAAAGMTLQKTTSPSTKKRASGKENKKD